MLTVDDYGIIRRAYRDGMSVRAIARTFHHSRRKIRQVLAEPQPRPYTRVQEPAAPKLGPFKAVIDRILTDDEEAPPKQRHTAAQVFRRLRDEEKYAGGYDQVRRYIGLRRKRDRETFIPLAHDPGRRLELDFGHIYADFPEGRRQVAVLLPTWSWSNCPYARALPTERIEAILSGMVSAFEFFGCVPREAWWDNPRTVVQAVLRGRERLVHPAYAALASHYAFEPLFCMPARGNEKPYAENRVYDLQRRWATPVPAVKDYDDLNAHLLRQCLEERQRTSHGQTETIGVRFERERAAAIALPLHAFDPCVQEPRKADKYQTVAYDGNRYSVPRRWAFEAVMVKAYVERVEVVAGGQTIARHGRSYGQGEQVLDPCHYLVTLGRRPAALDHSSVFRDWRLPATFDALRTSLEERHGPLAGARHYIRVLQLLAEHPVARVEQGIALCRPKGLGDAEAIRREVERLALREAPSTSPEVAAIRPELHVEVPRPDLVRFNQLLDSGDPCHVGPDDAAAEGQSEAVAVAGDVGGVREAGA
ncbi:MAG TPA: IS21 family transposase [Phycisphaerae bacterium]|nr:IS21 family transposase [Phycisphaerae bacterium]